MTTRSHRLIDPAVLSAADATYYTVPAERVALVKSMRLVNTTGADVLVDVALNVLDAAHALFWQALVPAGGIVNDSSWWVAEPGDEIHARADHPDAVVLWASGAELPAST